MSRRGRRSVLVGAGVTTVAVVAAVTWVAVNPRPIDGVCRRLSEGHAFATVPGDVLEKAAESSEVRLQDLTEPSSEQLATTRAVLEQRGWGEQSLDEYAACLVDYSRVGRAADPDAEPPLRELVERIHAPALLLYRESEHPEYACFGTAADCAGIPTYPVHCALFTDAETGLLLRLEGCWGFKRER